MPAPADVAARLVENNKRFFEACRKRDIPIIHLVTAYRDVDEIRSNPRWRALADSPDSTRRNVDHRPGAGDFRPGCAERQAFRRDEVQIGLRKIMRMNIDAARSCRAVLPAIAAGNWRPSRNIW